MYLTIILKATDWLALKPLSLNKEALCRSGIADRRP